MISQFFSFLINVDQIIIEDYNWKVWSQNKPHAD